MYNRMVVVKSRRKGKSDRFFFLSGSCNSNLVRAKEGERGGGGGKLNRTGSDGRE